MSVQKRRRQAINRRRWVVELREKSSAPDSFHRTLDAALARVSL